MPAAVAWIGLAISAYSAVSQHKAQSAAADAQQQAIQDQKQAAAKAEASKPQASQAPSAQGVQSSVAGMGQGGGAPGVAQTFLTGAGGVDPSLMNIGKATLLGG